MKLKQLFTCILLCLTAWVSGQNTSSVTQPDSFLFFGDTAATDSFTGEDGAYANARHRSGFGLLDSLSNDSTLRSIVKPYQFIAGEYTARTHIRRNLPTIKEVKVREQLNAPWKFWVILFIFAYISFVRIANPNNFRVFMLSVFNLKQIGRAHV